jgi:hypothetical protein
VLGTYLQLLDRSAVGIHQVIQVVLVALRWYCCRKTTQHNTTQHGDVLNGKKTTMKICHGRLGANRRTKAHFENNKQGLSFSSAAPDCIDRFINLLMNPIRCVNRTKQLFVPNVS